MLKIYCTECGSPTSYSVSKPKFCSNCGSPFEKTVVNKVQLQRKTISQVKDIEEDDNYDETESEVNYVPEINKIDCEIIEIKKRGEKIGNIVGTSSGGEKIKRAKNNKKLTKAERKKFLEDFAKEAGSLRPKSKEPRNG
jgi:uncharacterized Zn finger protein (UPF0148 family)